MKDSCEGKAEAGTACRFYSHSRFTHKLNWKVDVSGLHGLIFGMRR